MGVPHALLNWGIIALGALSLALGLRADTLTRLSTYAWAVRWPAILAGGLLLLLGLLLLYWSLRPNRAQVAPSLRLETWPIVDDGGHNGFTDMLAWHGSLWLAYVSSPSHFASARSRLILLRSEDARHWQEVGRFDGAGEDIRDPKLAVIHDHLFLYALLNRQFDPEPYKTIVARSEGGVTWTPFEDAHPAGWLLGRPRTLDSATWYAPAHRIEHGAAVLLRSADGVRWAIHSTIHDGDGADETAIEFLPDGRLVAAARLEAGGGLFGSPQASTLIAVAAPPYEAWTPVAKSRVTRLDGPNLFTHNNQVYAVGRYQPHTGGPLQWPGSALSRKRTSLFLLSQSDLVHLSDLPSAGDTSYAGVALRGDRLLVCYYSNDTQRDFPWVMGMLYPTGVHVAAIELASLEALASQT